MASGACLALGATSAQRHQADARFKIFDLAAVH